MNEEQPAPQRNDQPAVWDLVIADMQERNRVGTERYGTPLQAHNGRDALVDAYQEALDLVVYLRQEIEERKGSEMPEVVVLCGSTRFIDAFREWNLELTLGGKIVLSIGCDTKSDDALRLKPEDKDKLDELHLRKIDLADRVLVLNVDGYVGESTRREIAYAERLGKPIYYLEPTLGSIGS